MKAIARIPFGETRTYKEVAAMAGSPKGARAVGRPWGEILCPDLSVTPRCCRRGLGGFGSGLDVKRYLLEYEGGNRRI